MKTTFDECMEDSEFRTRYEQVKSLEEAIYLREKQVSVIVQQILEKIKRSRK